MSCPTLFSLYWLPTTILVVLKTMWINKRVLKFCRLNCPEIPVGSFTIVWSLQKPLQSLSKCTCTLQSSKNKDKGWCKQDARGHIFNFFSFCFFNSLHYFLYFDYLPIQSYLQNSPCFQTESSCRM